MANVSFVKRKNPVNVKARIQQYQDQQQNVNPNSPKRQSDGFVKSKSFNDLQSMTLAEDGWVVAGDTKLTTQREHSPLATPPKPPARRKKIVPNEERPLPPTPPQSSSPKTMPRVNKQTKQTRPSDNTTQESKDQLTSTDLFLLPKSGKPSLTLKPVPPRPPPPFLKPTRRTPEPKPLLDNTNLPENIRQVSEEHKQNGENSRDRKGSGGDKSSGTETSSLSDSVEEEKHTPKITPTSATPTASLRSSFFGRAFARQSLSHLHGDTCFENSVELEESFDVIPDTNTNLEDMVMKMKERDAKLHEASIYEVVQAVAREVPHCASTRDLPSSISGFPTGSRELVLHELYTTEYSYVRQLEVVVEVFKPQLSPLLGEDSSHVFANVDDILAFNRGFLALLHSRFKEWTPVQCIGDIFLGMFTQAHKSMYAIYCSNYDSAESLVLRLRRRKDVEAQLQICHSDPRISPGLTLPMFLITPVQRVPRYILLLKDIIKRTEEKHPDFEHLKQALQKMGELADYINLQIQEAQTKKTLEHLKSKVQGLSDLEQPNRTLVKEGQVYLQNIKKLYQCILFNDLLVFALGDSRQSTVQLNLNLDAVWVEDVEDRDPQTSSEDAIEIYTPQRPYRIYVRSNSEKKLWLPKLQETIYHHLMSTNHCLRNDKLDSTSRKARFIYFDQRSYTGDYHDAMRHGKGTMVWPNHSQYIGDWVENERCGEGEFRYNTGDIYIGRWKEDKQNGWGELRYYTGDVYQGAWKDGLRQGKGKVIYSNGDIFTGTFSSGHIEGNGKLVCTNGVEYNGEWKNSLRHGNGTLKTLQGNVYEGKFAHNLMHGHGIMKYSNGDVYEGNWKNGMRQGTGTFTSKLLGKYEGSWDRDLYHGKGVLKYTNGDVYEGFWEYNKRHGSGTLKYSTGELYTGEFKNNLKVGYGEMKYSAVKNYKGQWENDMPHGQGTMTYEDESTYTGAWDMGLRQGTGTLTRKNDITYTGQWDLDQPNGKGDLNIPAANYKYSGDWINGKREGRGIETAEYGSYSGGWRFDMKHGHGEEQTTVRTIFNGQWERGRKHGSGERKIAYGLIEEQHWKSGQLQNDPFRMTAVELPSLSRLDL